MAARSLGLSYAQTMRYVVVPQAVRRVIPPLLNDFIGLQKDTAIVSRDRRRRGGVAGAAVLDARTATSPSYIVAAVLLHPDHDPARALHRPPDRAARAARARAGVLSAAATARRRSSRSQDVSKWFGDLQVLERRRPRRRRAQRRLPDRRVRLGQVDAAALPQPARARRGGRRSSSTAQSITNGKVDVNALRRKIGIVFQAYNLFPHMTVLQNVMLAPRKVRGVSRERGRGARTRAARAHRARGEGRRVSRPALAAASSSASRSCARSRWSRS